MWIYNVIMYVEERVSTGRILLMPEVSGPDDQQVSDSARVEGTLL